MGKRFLLALIAGLTLTAVAVACGNDNDDDTALEEVTPAASPAVGGGVDAPTPVAATPTAATPAAAATPTSTPAAAAPAAPTPEGPQELAVLAGDYFYDPKEFRVQPGTVVVTMENEGPDRRHTFAVRGLNGGGDLIRSEQAEVGSTITVEFTVEQAGTYEVYCTLPGHADRGQTATLIVEQSAARS